MRRLRLTIAYDGTGYVGWQRQNNGPSIQAALEDAFFQMTGERREIRGASRTDAGVHADGQVAHVETESTIKPYGFYRGLNSLVTEGIAVQEVAEAAPDFNALDNRGKLYRYRIWCARAEQPRLRRYSWLVPHELELSRMREAARLLVGEHDFGAFRAADCERKTSVRRVHRLELVRRGSLLTLDIEGTGFLKNMVRIITGTLVEVGSGRFSPADVAAMLASRDRTQSGQTAPAHGLTLVKVLY